LHVALVPDKTWQNGRQPVQPPEGGLPLHNVIEIPLACPARARFLSLRTSHLFREHGRKPEKLFLLNIETDAVGMAAFTDVGMELAVIRQVIENICHQFRFDAAECDLTQIMPVTSEVCDG
jgi:hypothetical protein